MPQAILVTVIQAMLFYHLLVQLINVPQFVMQLHLLTRLQAILAIVLMDLLCRYQLMLLQTINSVIELVNKLPQLTMPQAILVTVIQAMLFYH